MNRVTAGEIAELAGVSQSTVSRALRGSPLVNSKTRERVLRIANEKNYKVNTGASRLRSRQSRTLALLVHDDSEMGSDINPFFLSMIAAITKAATEKGYDILVGLDDLPSIAYTTPPLTTVRQDTATAGRVLVDTLLDVVRGNDVVSRLLPPELIVRQSSRRLRPDASAASRTGPRLTDARTA